MVQRKIDWTRFYDWGRIILLSAKILFIIVGQHEDLFRLLLCRRMSFSLYRLDTLLRLGKNYLDVGIMRTPIGDWRIHVLLIGFPCWKLGSSYLASNRCFATAEVSFQWYFDWASTMHIKHSRVPSQLSTSARGQCFAPFCHDASISNLHRRQVLVDPITVQAYPTCTVVSDWYTPYTIVPLVWIDRSGTNAYRFTLLLIGISNNRKGHLDGHWGLEMPLARLGTLTSEGASGVLVSTLVRGPKPKTFLFIALALGHLTSMGLPFVFTRVTY